jgi:glycosyltransferase involved in cell wall biosynthesis
MPTLSNCLAGIDVDILHGNFPSPYIAFLVAAASATRRIPAVLTWHNDLPPVTPGAESLIKIHDRFILPRYLSIYRRVISTSPQYAMISRILPTLGAKLAIVPNGVDSEKFSPEIDGSKHRSELNLGNRYTLLFVGALTRWHRYKGLDVLLRALAIAIKNLPSVALLVVGDGELKGDYELQSEKLGLNRNVIFVGNVSNNELPQYYAASDALIQPSKDMSEGFGLTLLEANATGKPVIASNVGGIPSVVKNWHNGMLVPPNDPELLSKAILTLHENRREALEMGRCGRKVAVLHDWKNTASKTECIYEEVLAR